MYRAILALSLGLFSISAACASEVVVSASKGVQITVYNQNFGLVKDKRSMELGSGINHVRFEDVAAGIDPTSVSFASLSNPNGVVVREQNYQFDLMDQNTILSKSVGKQIKLQQIFSGGQVKEITGTLLSSPLVTVADSNGNIEQRSQALVLKTASGVVLNPQGQVELAELPPGLVAKPSLLWKLESNKAGREESEISYQTQGLNWKCDYVAVSNADDTALDITSWVTIDNKSGATYDNAALKLMAGDVHKVQEARPEAQEMMADVAMARAPEPQFKEQSFAEYHLYSLNGTTDLKDNETKQLTLFNAQNVPSKKVYIFDGASAGYGDYDGGTTAKGKVNLKIELDNSSKNNLGLPMPKGKVRVYKRDKDGAMQFVGEDLIDHTPKDEKVRLYLGDAFDIVAERKQITQEQVSNRVTRASYSISLRNHKEVPVTVTCVEHAWGDWKITQSSHKPEKKDAHTFEFQIPLPKDGEVTLTYTIETRY